MQSPIKNRLLRRPGQSLEKQLEGIFLDDVLFPIIGSFILLLLAALEWWRWYQPSSPSPLTMTAFALLFFAYAVWKLCRTIPRARELRLGLDGERAVGQFLERLIAADAAVIHDFPGDGFNLDHLVVHPSGIYYVETQTLTRPESGELKLHFDGESIRQHGQNLPGNTVEQARYGARWLREFILERTALDIPVRAVLAFPGCVVESSAAALNSDVWVLEPKVLPELITVQSAVLDRDKQGVCVRFLRDHVRESEL